MKDNMCMTLLMFIPQGHLRTFNILQNIYRHITFVSTIVLQILYVNSKYLKDISQSCDTPVIINYNCSNLLIHS